MNFSHRAPAASSRHLEAFLEMLVAERGASSNTLDAYRRDLLGFLNHAGELGKDFLTADSDALRQYMRAQAKAGMSARTSRAVFPPCANCSSSVCRRLPSRQPFAADRSAEATPVAAQVSERRRRSTGCSPPPRARPG